MRAVLVERFGAVPSVADVPDPTCPPDGVVLRVGATGLCRSDWHGWMGHDPDIVLPHVPGHEFAGVVVEVGTEVRTVQVGERVTAPFVCACGRCPTCRRGEQQVCERQQQPGFTHWGSFAEYVVVDAADVNVVSLPDGVGVDTAAALGCRVATAHRAVTVHARPAPGDWLSVHGCGGVGLSAVMIGVDLGARVVALDPSPVARQRALELGAEAALDPADDLVALTGGGAAASIDAIGGVESLVASVHGLRRRGRHVQVGLMGGAGSVPASVIGRAVSYELELIGSHGLAARHYPQLLAAVSSGRLDVGRLIRRRIGLSAAATELAALGSVQVDGITVIDPAAE